MMLRFRLNFHHNLRVVFMNLFTSFRSVFARGLFSLSVLGSVVFASDAKVVKKSGQGEASFTPPGASKIIIKSAGGEVIPEHSLIETGPGAELMIETFAGAVATVRQNSSLVIDELSSSTRKARLNLKSGNIVSTLDPARRSNTDYGVVTPSGVAAARGTVYSVKVVPSGGTGANTSVATLSGMVIIDRGAGFAPLQVPFGQGSANSAAAQALATLAAGDPTVAADILSAVQSVAANVGANTSAAGSSANAITELAAVTAAATAAVPSQASVIVQAAVQGAVTAGSTTSGSQQATLAAVSAVTEAAVRAVATSNPGQIIAITQAAASAVTSSGSTTGANDAAVIAAVSAVTSAAVNAAPGQAAAAAQGAAQGVINTKVTEAVNTAKASNPAATGDELAQIANQASNSSGATAAVSTVATTATSRLLVLTGQSSDGAAAGATASMIASAVNSGSTAGATTGAGTTITVPKTTSVTGPQVTVNVSQTVGGSTVTSNSGAGTTTSTSSQTIAGSGSGGPITTQTGSTTVTIGGSTTPNSGAAPGANGNTTILPPLDQTQQVISPSKQ